MNRRGADFMSRLPVSLDGHFLIGCENVLWRDGVDAVALTAVPNGY
jgi:hypothetical protein